VLVVPLALMYVGYSILWYGVEYALGVPVTLGDVILPWRETAVEKAVSWAKTQSGSTPASSGPRGPTPPSLPSNFPVPSAPPV
jgi:hypothetical protein